ncbi:MAG: quinone-dependent dihydroorotate dehydrogenase [Bacteroidales bacterium]|nr:quinone-dependent dihydroorotate dehydrogenase [Bacteroidales bacterium]
MYKLIRPILFLIQPEKIHRMTMNLLKFCRCIPMCRTIIRWMYSYSDKGLERELFGVTFKNPVGLAAGFDKNGEMYNDLANFGFSFIEIGSLTPRPQDGNPQPRSFRLPKDKALINRMGINNNGARYAANCLVKDKPARCRIAASITKNADTPNENAYKDYEKSFAILYDFVDFFVLNVSCPNVKNLTELQDIPTLAKIFDHINTIRRLNDDNRPVLLKVSPDIPIEQLDEILDLVLINGIEGVVATNTTRSRENLVSSPKVVESIGNGGLSGAPLFDRSKAFVQHIHEYTKGILPIIACGGIMTPKQALEMLDAGASLIEIYTGFVYNGPAYVKRINRYLAKAYAKRKQ